MPRLRPDSILNRPDPPGLPAPQAPTPPARFGLSPQYQFVSLYNPVTSVYRQRFDEALRNSQEDALAMWRNGLIQEQLARRWRSGRRLKWHIEPDDPREPSQKAAAAKYTKLVEAIPRFSQLRLAVQERMWYGRGGANLAWGREWVDGSKVTTVVDHVPVNGDSIGFHFKGWPKIQVNSVLQSGDGFPAPHAINDDRGRSILLDTREWREQFIVGKFEPHAPDWGFEPEMALAVHGYGLRGRLYWTWWLLNEVQAWHLDALRRFGSNGMLYGYYPDGDDAAAEAMLAALKQIVMENVTVFPVKAGQQPDQVFHDIPAANIAYEVQAQFVEKMEGVVKRAICGTEETNSGSVGASEFSKDAFDDIVMCDAEEEGEILTRDLLRPMIRMNDGELPFRLRVVVQPKHQDVGEKLAAARVLFDMGVPLDSEDLYALASISPPRDGANVVRSPQAAAAMAQPGQPGPDNLGADTGRPPSRNLPVGLNANMPRSMRSGGDEPAAGMAGQKPGIDGIRDRYRAALAAAKNGKAPGAAVNGTH